MELELAHGLKIQLRGEMSVFSVDNRLVATWDLNIIGCNVS